MKQMMSACVPSSFCDLCNKNLISEDNESAHNINLTDNNKKQTNTNNANNKEGKKIIQDSQQSSFSQISNQSLLSDKSNLVLANQVITNDLIKGNMKFLLEERDSTKLLLKEKLTINAAGLVNGARKANDGFAFFGLTLHNSLGTIVNDYEFDIPMENIEVNNESNHPNNDHLFLIYFKKLTQRYYIKAYINPSPINPFPLLKLPTQLHPYPIKDNEYLMVGDMLFKCGVDTIGELVLVKLSTHNFQQELVIKFQQNQEKVTIGRDKTCSLPFPNNTLLSKVQCTFEYTNQSWMVHDGENNSPTLHGSWISFKHSVDITNGCMFKLYNTTTFALSPLP